MMNRLALLISYILHPVFMPTAGMIILTGYLSPVRLPFMLQAVIVSCVFFFTCVIPVLSIVMLRRFNHVSNIHLPVREERKLPLVISCGSYFAAYYLVHGMSRDAAMIVPLVHLTLLSGLAVLLVVFFVNHVYKISIHMAAAGSLAAMLSVLASPGTEGFVIAAFIACGLVGFSRLQLKAHSTGEVAMGFLSGFIIQFLILQLLPGSLF